MIGEDSMVMSCLRSYLSPFSPPPGETCDRAPEPTAPRASRLWGSALLIKTLLACMCLLSLVLSGCLAVGGTSTCDTSVQEICNGIDDNCDSDGQIDEGVKSTFYQDSDGDSYGNASVTTQACTRPWGYADNAIDCNDNDLRAYPGAAEVCNLSDGTCKVRSTFYHDADEDSYGNRTVPWQACDKPTGYEASDSDCDDTKSTVYPGALEICDALDNDCDGRTDEGVTTTYYPDTDQDGYGGPGPTIEVCNGEEGYVTDGTDCNDTDTSIHPGLPEACDDKDNDCNGLVDEGVLNTYFPDSDGDGYGDPSSPYSRCTTSAPSGYASNSGDCDDSRSNINPGEEELCDGIDNDCAPETDEKGDEDNDGYTICQNDCNDKDPNIYPRAYDVIGDGVDSNCDGRQDYIFLFAGGGIGDGGPSTRGAIFSPSGVASDSDGSIYISDWGHHRIRRVDSSGIITTIAGTGLDASTGDGGPASIAELSFPSGIALGKHNNLFIVDSGNGEDDVRVREMYLNGTITTIVGGGTNPTDPVLATNAQFRSINGVAVDSSGDLYIANSNNGVVQKIEISTGAISIFAGNLNDIDGGDGGAATAAQLYYPGGLAFDTDNNLYILEGYGCRLRRVDHQSGVITTSAGDGTCGYGGDGGPATEAGLASPHDVTLDSTGNLFIADGSTIFPGSGDGNRIRKVAPDGTITTFAGQNGTGSNGDGGPAVDALLYVSSGLTFDTYDNLYVAQFPIDNFYSYPPYDHRIRKIARSDGIISTFAGTGTATYCGDGGPATGAQLNEPSAIWLDKDSSLYIADTGNGVAWLVTSDGTIMTTVAGVGYPYTVSGDDGPATETVLDKPIGVVGDAHGNLFISEGDLVRQVSGGEITTIAGGGEESACPLVDNLNAVEARFSKGAGQLALEMDESGNGISLFIAVPACYQVLRMDLETGILEVYAGKGSAGNTGADGTAASDAQLTSPAGLTLDNAGTLYIADEGASIIRRVNPDGTIYTAAGGGNKGYSGDGGPATAALLNAPGGVTLDDVGNLFIADTENNRIRKVDLNGDITTIAGSGSVGATGDSGPAINAQLNAPYALAFDTAGRLYVAEKGNNLIRIIIP